MAVGDAAGIGHGQTGYVRRRPDRHRLVLSVSFPTVRRRDLSRRICWNCWRTVGGAGVTRGRGHPDPAHDDESRAVIAIQQLTAFIVRARRVEAHPLAADRVVLAQHARGTINIENVDGESWAVTHYPTEDVLESAAARVRPFTLQGDPVHHKKVADAITLFVRRSAPGDAHDYYLAVLSNFRKSWTDLSRASGPIRGFGVQQLNVQSGVTSSITDRRLGHAWLYGDVFHADSTAHAAADPFGVQQRFEAAVPLVCGLMCLTIANLTFLRLLVGQGVVPIAGEAFSDMVVAQQTHRQKARVFVGPAAGAPGESNLASIPPLNEPLGPDWQELIFPPPYNDAAAPEPGDRSDAAAGDDSAGCDRP